MDLGTQASDAYLNCRDLRHVLLARRPAVRLIAVSKGQSPEKIRALYVEGQREFGENYLDELEHKADALSALKDLKWVFIGQLQSNKIQRIMKVATEIQTVASEKHARYIARYATELDKAPYPVFIEINCDEEQKGGATRQEALNVARFIQRECPGIRLRGLMAVPPSQFTDAIVKDIPPLYQDLVQLAHSIGEGELSLGMTADRGIALAAGSTCLRIGRALFGARS